MNASKLFVSLLVIMVFASCQKDLEAPAAAGNTSGSGLPSVSSRLTSGNWKFTGSIIKYSDGTVDNTPPDICKTDDLYQYETDGDATVTFGMFPCGTDPASGKYADWQLVDGGARLVETYTRNIFNVTAGAVLIYNIEFISDRKLILSRNIIEAGKTYTEINTYIK